MTLLPASVVAGLLYDHIDNGAPFYYGSFMALLAAICMLIFTKNIWRPFQMLKIFKLNWKGDWR